MIKKTILIIGLTWLISVPFLTKKETIELVEGTDGTIVMVSFHPFLSIEKERYVIPLVPSKSYTELFEEENFENKYFIINTKRLFGLIETIHSESIDGTVLKVLK